MTPPLHALPWNPEKLLPKFYLGEGIPVDDHLHSFFLALEGLVVEHEDVVCKLFPHTLKGKAASWYFGLQANSITYWNTFEILFKNKFGIQRTTAALMKELLALRKEKKEKVQDFSQRFVAHLKKFSAAINPTEETLIEYYTSALGPDIAMFVKRSVKPSLVETYEEAVKIEAELESINKYSAQREIRNFGRKKPLLLTRPKAEHSHELENVVKWYRSYPTKSLIWRKKRKTRNNSCLIIREKMKVVHPNHLCIVLLL